MVEGEIAGMHAAILAGVIIAQEDFAPRQLGAWMRAADHVGQPDHRRGMDVVHRGVNDRVVQLQHFRLPVKHKDQRPPDIAHVERFVILVQDQHRRVDFS